MTETLNVENVGGDAEYVEIEEQTEEDSEE